MPHFYVNPSNIRNNLFTMDAQQAHYVYTVRRFSSGDNIMIFDGLGNSYSAEITKVSKDYIEGRIISSSYKMPDFTVNLYTAIPKGDRYEWLIEKAGELGVAAIMPINTKRSINTSFSESKLERYEKISVAASSQCGRNDIMKIYEPADFEKACCSAAAKPDFINILPWESEESKASVGTALKSAGKPAGVDIFIGPEGGFENKEVEFAKNLGIRPVTLGNNILRVETAAIVAGVLVFNSLYEYGDK